MMDLNNEAIEKRLEECGIPAIPGLAEKMRRYHELLMDWNTRMDLTAVTEAEEMLDRHYMDSLMPLTVPGLLPTGGTIIDVGTGAGFPGLPLALVCPDAQVTLLDAQQKRLTFLQAVVDELHVDNVTLVHARAEDGARQKELRERFDVAVARAVAPASVLAEYLLPYVKVGGKALFWKGPALTEELESGRRAAFLLGGKVKEPIAYRIPGRDWQHLLLPVEKVRGTARQYPRKAGTPAKEPLA